MSQEIWKAGSLWLGLVLILFTPMVSHSFLDSIAVAQSDGKALNVREFGARGNGLADDTAAIQKVINKAGKGTQIFFPAGVYIVSNLSINGGSGLSFVGEGRTSVIKQKTGAPRIATFAGATDVVITRITFDANGISSYGGVAFYDAKRVRIENTWFIDSVPKPIGREDRYAYVFGKGRFQSEEIQILGNTIEDLQLEVNHSRRVVIEGNTVRRAVRTAGIGIFSVDDRAIAEDYMISGNTIIDPIGAGLNVGIDPPTNSHCVFRRISIVRNKIIRTKTADFGIRIGTPDNSKRTTGNVFEDLVIKDNHVQVKAGAPAPAQVIFGNASADIVLSRLEVTGNTIENEASGGREYAIDLRRVQNSVVAGNTVKGAANGLSLGGDVLSNEIRNNLVEASDVAYVLEGSLGENKVIGNRVIGKPRELWKTSTLKPSDSIEW